MFLGIYILYILYEKKIFLFEIFNLLFLIDFILIAGILPLLERKYLALLQRRIGPKYIGYKGR